MTATRYARELRHSRNVRRLKFLLPAAAGMVMLAMVGRSVALSYLAEAPVSVTGATIRDGRLVMQNPRMGGYNALKRPYEMTAARAIQSFTDSSYVDLEEISARLPVGVVDWAAVEAATGTMTKADNTLHVTSPMLVETTDGLVARFKSARIDMGRGDIRTDEPVEITTGTTRVTAERMTIEDGGSVMVFERRVRMVIEGRRTTTAQAGATHANN